jgi:FAD/FMN-containing dehydrogenase
MNTNPIAENSSQLASALPALDWITDSLKVSRLSQDFSWFSPVLKQALQGKRGDIAVRPRTEAEIAQVVAHCARRGVPITLRGSGTGNYGQSTPLHGGVILDLSGYNSLCWVRGSVGRAQAGIRLADFDQLAREQGRSCAGCRPPTAAPPWAVCLAEASAAPAPSPTGRSPLRAMCWLRA